MVWFLLVAVSPLDVVADETLTVQDLDVDAEERTNSGATKRKKRKRKVFKGTETPSVQQSAGINVTYKNADGEERNLDEDIRVAAVSGNLKDLKKLLDIRKEISSLEGAEVSPRDKYGNSPLHDVARRGLIDVAEILLGAGYAANLKNGMGDTPLHMAASSGRLPMTKLLLEHGAELDGPTNWGMTPLYWAANGGSDNHLNVAKYLVSKGADLNVQNHGKYTALHEAAREGHLKLSKLLLTSGIDGNARELGNCLANWHAHHVEFESLSSYCDWRC